MLVMCSKGCTSHQLLILYMVAINIYNITRLNRGTGDPLQDAKCILSEQDQFFESPEEFMDDSLDYGDPNDISFKTDDRYANYEFKTEEHTHQHALEVLNDHINEINYYDDSKGQYHLVDSHDPIALFRVCKYN